MSPEPLNKSGAEAPTPATLPRAAAGARSIGAAGQVVLAVVAVLAACYFAKTVFIALLIAILLAFILAPLVELLERLRVPRALGALLVVLLLLGMMAGLGAYSYNKAVDFWHDLPRYSDKIRDVITRFQQKAESLQRTTQNVLPKAASNPKETTVRVEQSANWGDWLFRGAGSVTEVLFAVGFIPFLVYFMLSWQEHVRAATVMLFALENRNTAYVALGEIARMIRSFIVGNMLLGLFTSAVTLVVFGFLGLPYFYFLGLISGFLSLIPYLGVLLALVPPLVAGLGQLHGSGVLIIVATVLGLHLFALNVLYPKFVGSRAQLNPLAVTLALLLWGWLWGALGLVLAVPLTAAMKIIFDHVDSLHAYGTWLGE